MKQRAMYAYLLAMVLIAFMVFASAACRVTGGVTAADATATYGAQQFHAQLTAQAVQATRGALP